MIGYVITLHLSEMNTRSHDNENKWHFKTRHCGQNDLKNGHHCCSGMDTFVLNTYTPPTLSYVLNTQKEIASIRSLYLCVDPLSVPFCSKLPY